LLVINKIDLAPHVGAALDVMDRDARKMRGSRPFVFTNLKNGTGLADVLSWLERHVTAPERSDLIDAHAPHARGSHEHHHAHGGPHH